MRILFNALEFAKKNLTTGRTPLSNLTLYSFSLGYDFHT